MKVKCILFVCALAAGGFLVSLKGELQATLVRGSKMAPGDIAMTFDDFPPKTAPNGVNNGDTLRVYLKANGVSAAVFVIGCPFQNLPLSGASPICFGTGTESISLVQRWADDYFNIGNHSFSHQAYIVKNPMQILVDAKLNQWVLSPYQTDGIQFFRFPYLEGGTREIAAMLQTTDLTGVFPVSYNINLNNVDMGRLRGPVDTDMGGQLIKPDGTQLLDANGNGGGDTLCYTLKWTAKDCANLYLNSLRASGVMITHIAGDTIPGGSNPWTVIFHETLVQGLIAKGYRLVPVDAIPGLLGDIQAVQTKMVSGRFGSDEGQGPVVFGDIGGNKRADACKAFGQDIACMLSESATFNEKRTVFREPRTWFHVDDRNWSAVYDRRFMLVDWNGSGRKDLLIPVSQGILVARSNGRGFVTEGIWSTKLPFAWLHFADIDGNGGLDAVAIVGNQIVAARKNGTGFDPARVLAALPSGIDWTDPKYGSTLQAGDIDGDGLPDLVVRGPSDVWVSLNGGQKGFAAMTSWSRRLPDWQGWDQQYQTLSLVHAEGSVWLGGGLAGGIVIHRAQPEQARFGRYSYINNTDYSSLPNWNADRYASQLSFANLDGGRNDSFIMVKPGGLYAAPIVKVTTMNPAANQ